MPEKTGKKFLILSIIGLFIGNPFSCAFCQEAEDLVRMIDEQQRKIQTFSASFFQKKETSLVKDPLYSSGLVKFKRPDRIHWIYVKPEAMEVAIDGKTIWTYTPGRPTAEQYSLALSKKMNRALEPLTSVFQKPFAELSTRYTVTYEGLEDNRVCHFHLKPTEEKVQRVLSGVDLWIDKTSGAILRFKMTEASGDRLSLEFKNLQINPPLTDDDLTIKIPPSVRVLEQRGP